MLTGQITLVNVIALCVCQILKQREGGEGTEERERREREREREKKERILWNLASSQLVW